MATWGSYLTSFVRKNNEEPAKDPSLIVASSTTEVNQPLVESVTAKSLPTSKIAVPAESSPGVQGVKKLYDLNPSPDSKLEPTPPKFNSNAARVAKMFGYGSPVAPVSSEKLQNVSIPTTVVSVTPAKSVAPENPVNLQTPPQLSTPVIPPILPAKQSAEETPRSLLGPAVAVTTPETSKNVAIKPSGLYAWAFGSSTKSKEPTKEIKDTKSPSPQLKSKNQEIVTPSNSVKKPSEFQTSLENIKSYNGGMLPSANLEATSLEPTSISTGLGSSSILSSINSSRFDARVSAQSKLITSQQNVSAFNSSRPGSVASSASVSTRYNQSSSLSSPISRRDSIFSHFSTSSLRPFDNSLTSIEEKVARELRLQAEKEHRMKLMAFTKSIEEMRIEREKMEFEKKKMMDEKAAFERDEYQLKDKEEQMRIFVADFELEKEREIREQEKLRLEQEEEKRRQLEEEKRRQLEEEKRRQEEEEEKIRQQEALRIENEEKIRKQIEDREQRELQQKMFLEKKRAAEQDEKKEEKRNNSTIPKYNLDTESDFKNLKDKEDISKQRSYQEDDDDYSIYDDYYDEKSNLEEDSLDFQGQLESKIQNNKAKQDELEEDEYEKELEMQRFLQESRQREEEEERRRYAEDQAKRFRQQPPIQAGSPEIVALEQKSPQINLPQMGLPQMGSPQMRPQMGSPQMRPQMGSPQMRPQMGSPQMRPQMGSPQMRPQMGPPQMRPQMGSPQMRSQMGPPQMRPQMGSPQMRPQMGSPQMRPQMGPPQMRSQMNPQQAGPRMGPQQMRPQMGSPQVRPVQNGQQVEQGRMLPPRQQRSEERDFRRQENEESEDEEANREEEIRKAEIKMRKAFAEMSLQKSMSQMPVQDFEPQPRTPPRKPNLTYITPAGGLPSGPRKGNRGLPARPR
ncbi:hypothetical protein EV44_g5024 [Erysiphe necator]|uniref:Uncharacterized protein n=1 Tax=Uncinula necator TaxID=52586 RepID=A0A0B1P8B0_UNCNE|nr:hypothetical protein EV44_g5024 [Erysiphe necator]